MRIRVYKLEDSNIAVRYGDEEQYASMSGITLAFPGLHELFMSGRPYYVYQTFTKSEFESLTLIEDLTV